MKIVEVPEGFVCALCRQVVRSRTIISSQGTNHPCGHQVDAVKEIELPFEEG